MPDAYWQSVARAAEEARKLAALNDAKDRERRLRETAARARETARRPDSSGRLHCAHCRRWLPRKGFWKDKAAGTGKGSWCRKCLSERGSRAAR